jgi:twinkle protein
LELLPAASGITFFPSLEGGKGGRSKGVFFKYADGWKARAVPEKAFVASKGWKPGFWNLERVLDALQGGGFDVYITEGELDAASLVESGLSADQVLSVPNGASGASSEAGIPYLVDALRGGLNMATKIIWCGDADEVGLALREQFAQQFGIAKFWYVDWPEGIKDANDLLMKEGPNHLRNYLLREAQAWPTMGVYKLSELPEPPKFTLWEPRLENLRGKAYLAPRTLSVVTGQPGHGKSTLFGQLWFEIIRDYDLVGCFASFETRPKPHIRRQIRTLLNGMPEHQQTEGELKKADEWADAHYLFLNHPEQRPTLDWFLDQAEIACVRHGVKVLQLDPWNRLEASRTRDESETEYIARCLRALHVFAVDMNCHVQIIAHPAKMGGDRRGGIPELEDISGSKAWDAMVDQGFVVHRPRLFDAVGERVTKAKLVVRKTRFEELGYPLSVNIDYDLNERRFTPDYSSDLVEDP